MGFKAGESGICPHCGTAARFEAVVASAGQFSLLHVHTLSKRAAAFYFCGCPSCGELIASIQHATVKENWLANHEELIYPTGAVHPIPPEVDETAPQIASDFREAIAVLAKSPKASATLSRRCLQHILESKAGARRGTLDQQISDVLASLPQHLAENLDAVRTVGNFAAHPTKSTNTAEIVDVEPGEAEWLIEVLDGLFDFYFVAPARNAKRRELLNEKLAGIGKPRLKLPPQRPTSP